MRNIQNLFVCSLTAALVACANDDPAPEFKEGQAFLDDADFEGVWRQRGYGRVIQVGGDGFVVYDVTEVSCVPSDNGSRSQLGTQFERVRGNNSEFSWFEAGAFTRYDFDKIQALPASCAVQPADAVSNFNALVAYFSENYGFFEERGIQWAAIQQAGASLDDASSNEELMAVFQEMLAPFGDGHVYVFDPEGGAGFLGGSLGELWESWAAEAEGNPVGENPINPRGRFTNEMRAYVLSEILKDQGKSGLLEMLHWGWVAPGVGYVDVHAMGTYEAEISISEATELVHQEMAKVMADLRTARAMIIDVRFNEGGYDTVGYAIASWFSDRKRVISRKMAVWGDGFTAPQDIEIQARQGAYAGPVYLLTSRNTISAAETFALALRELPQVTLVGTRTYGSLSDSMGRLLPNGWLISLSNEIYESPAGERFEALGVPPDDEVTYDEKLTFRENLDAGLVRALTLAAIR